MSRDKVMMRGQIKRLLLTGSRNVNEGMGGATLTGAGLSHDYFQVVDRLPLDGLHSLATLLEAMYRMGNQHAHVGKPNLCSVLGHVLLEGHKTCQCGQVREEPYNPDHVRDGGQPGKYEIQGTQTGRIPSRGGKQGSRGPI